MQQHQLANFSVRIVDYIIHAETETDLPMAFPGDIHLFLQLSYELFFDKLIVFR